MREAVDPGRGGASRRRRLGGLAACAPSTSAASIVKPNQEEAEAASLRALGRVDFPALRRHMEAPLLIVTHGGEGAEIVDERGVQWVAAQAGGASGGYLRRGRQLFGGRGDGAEGLRRSGCRRRASATWSRRSRS